MSRIALLDIFQATFLVAAVAALVADRDHHRHKLADAIEARGWTDLRGEFGPLLWWRPWRWVAGLLFGLAVATKWNSLFALAAFGILSVMWDIGARRLAGAGFVSWTAILREGLTAFIALGRPPPWSPGHLDGRRPRWVGAGGRPGPGYLVTPRSAPDWRILLLPQGNLQLPPVTTC